TPNTVPAGTISGTVTFTDTNLVNSGGYYYIAAYASWPPTGNPTSGDTLIPVLNSGTYTASYTISGLPDTGNFVVTSAWLKVPYVPGAGIYGLGFYGCEPPSPSCVGNPSRVTLSSGVGQENINFKSNMDTASYLYKF
ncbi:MAG TPA: hypothetical protein VG961_04700, partial [Ignavibacteria bacterium]|nr:hypothetical protein [Ignavibacteria bacterium]